MGQTLPPLIRDEPPFKMSYSVLCEAMIDASIGPHRCDRVECSPEAMARILELVGPCLPRGVAVPPIKHCVYCRRETSAPKTCEGCGAPTMLAYISRPLAKPMKFMGADLVFGKGLMHNEMRFINTRCPQRSGSLRLNM